MAGPISRSFASPPIGYHFFFVETAKDMINPKPAQKLAINGLKPNLEIHALFPPTSAEPRIAQNIAPNKNTTRG